MDSITINVTRASVTTDRTSAIDPKSIAISRALTNQTDTMSFIVPRSSGSDWKPAMLDEIEVIDADSNVLFAGTIATVKETVDGEIELVECNCKDWSFEMDRKLVVQVYESMTVFDIIDDIVATYLPTFTGMFVDCTTVVEYIAFNYEYPSKCVQQLAELVGYDWYVDEDKNIQFFSKSSNVAPFSLTDTNGNYYIDSLFINRDATKIRNDVTVRGGTYLGSSYTESYIADGTQKTFPLVNKYNSITVTVNAVSKTVGIDNIDDATLFDCLYNFQEKAIKFTNASKPSATQPVVVSGQPYIPVLTKRTDGSSISTYGVFEYKIVNTSLGSKAGAQERARAEIESYAEALDEGGFVTRVNGLNVGDVINIQSDLRSIDEDFVITRIDTKISDVDGLLHQVTLSTTQTFGMVEFLQGLLMQKDKEIKIAADEVLDQLLGFADDVSIADSLSSVTTSSPPYVYDTARFGFATYS